MQYVVEADDFLLEYLTKQHMTFEVFEAKGWDAVAVGTAHLPLTVLLQDLQVQTGERLQLSILLYMLTCCEHVYCFGALHTKASIHDDMMFVMGCCSSW